jgi:hypothetical protein
MKRNYRNIVALILITSVCVLSGCIKVLSTDPANGSTSVPLNKSVRIILNREANPDTVKAGTLIVKDDSNRAVAGEIICSGKEILFTPQTLFAKGMKYSVTLKKQIKDKIGIGLKEYTFSFATASSSPEPLLMPHVLSVSPADGSSNIAFDASIRVKFDTPLLVSSVNSKSFIVKDSYGTSLNGDFSFSGDMKSLTFRPASPFSFMTKYNILLESMISSNIGIRLERSLGFSFTTEAEKKWDTPTPFLINNSTFGGTADLAMDNNGNAIVVFEEYDNLNHWVSRCEFRNKAWGEVEKMSISGNNASYPKVVMNDNNEAIIIWTEWYETYTGEGEDPVYTQELFSSSYKNGEWSVPERVEGMDNCISIALSNNGDAILTGYTLDDMYYINITGLELKEFIDGSWNNTLVKKIDTEEYCARNVQLEIDDSGNAIVTWLKDDYRECPSFFMKRNSHIWTEPEEIKSDALEKTILVLNRYGDLIADGILNKLFSWLLDPVRAEKNTKNNIIRRDVSEENGYHLTKKGDSVFLSWREYYHSHLALNNDRFYSYSSEYIDGEWTAPMLATNMSICKMDTWNLARPFRLDIDGRDNAVLAWPQREDQSGNFWSRDYGYYRIFRNEYRSGIWNYESKQISTAGRYSDYPKVAMDRKGNAIIIWQEWDGSKWQVFKNEYR